MQTEVERSRETYIHGGHKTTKLKEGRNYEHDTATRTGPDQRNQTLKFDLSRPGRVYRKHSPQYTTYSTHKSGKPEKSESQKITLPSILFLRIAGILPIAIIGTWTICGESFRAISRLVDT